MTVTAISQMWMRHLEGQPMMRLFGESVAGKIIIACCVLHNLCIRAGIAAPELTEKQFEAERGRQVSAAAIPTTIHCHNTLPLKP